MLGSGNYAVYDVLERFLPHDRLVVWYGIHVATKFGPDWHVRRGHGLFEPASGERAEDFDALDVVACSCHSCGTVAR